MEGSTSITCRVLQEIQFVELEFARVALFQIQLMAVLLLVWVFLMKNPKSTTTGSTKTIVQPRFILGLDLQAMSQADKRPAPDSAASVAKKAKVVREIPPDGDSIQTLCVFMEKEMGLQEGTLGKELHTLTSNLYTTVGMLRKYDWEKNSLQLRDAFVQHMKELFSTTATGTSQGHTVGLPRAKNCHAIAFR